MWTTSDREDQLISDLERLAVVSPSNSIALPTEDETQRRAPTVSRAPSTVGEPGYLPPAHNDHISSSSDSSENSAMALENCAVDLTQSSSDDESTSGVPLPEGTKSAPINGYRVLSDSGEEESADNSEENSDANEDFQLGSDDEEFFSDSCFTDPDPEAEQEATLEAHKAKVLDRIARQDGQSGDRILGLAPPQKTSTQSLKQEYEDTIAERIKKVTLASGTKSSHYLTIVLVSPFAEPLELDIRNDVSFIGVKVQFMHAIGIDVDQVDNLKFLFGQQVLDHQCTPDEVGLEDRDMVVVEIEGSEGSNK